MSSSTFKKVVSHFCFLFFLIIVAKTSPVKNFKRDLKSCLTSIKGQTVFPNDPNYKKDITDENTRVTFNPNAIVYASNVKDVQTAVKCAKSLNLTITARSGGHSYEKYSTFGKLVVDTSNLNEITINKQTKTAVIGSGNRLGPIYNSLSQAGFLIPAGTCPSVGIGGHALGGGFGFYSRKFGVALDNILSIDMVKADGSLITANTNQNEDLFFALRGAGGNNYGIVTSFTFQLHPTPPKVTSLLFQYEISNIQKLFNTINKFGLNLTDDVALSISVGSSSNSLELDGVYQGTQKNAKEVMKNFISSSNPSSTQFFEETFFSSVVRWGFESTQGTINPKHNPNDFKAKSFFVKSPGLSPDGIKSLQNFTSKLPSECPAFAEFDLFGGAVNRIAPDATAFVHRDILYGIQLYMNLNGDSNTNKGCIDQINKFGVTFQNSFTDYSSYQNYIDRDLIDWQHRYYGSNFPKLVDIKKKFDPDNFFNFPQSF